MDFDEDIEVLLYQVWLSLENWGDIEQAAQCFIKAYQFACAQQELRSE